MDGKNISEGGKKKMKVTKEDVNSRLKQVMELFWLCANLDLLTQEQYKIIVDTARYLQNKR